MKKGFDIHSYEDKLKGAIKSVRESNLTELNKGVILKYKDYLVMKGLGTPRIIKYLVNLKIIGLFLSKDFNTVIREDLEKFVVYTLERDCSDWTKQSYLVILKRFYRWLEDKDCEDYPEIVKWISVIKPKEVSSLPCDEMLLNEEDVLKLVACAENLRDKAFVYLLWESGTRIGEIGSLQIKNVEFDEHGSLITVDGKTGMRKLRLVNSTPYLANWLSVHPSKDREAPLWISLTKGKGEKICYVTANSLLKRLFKKARIDKKCNPHFFRHSRATYLANYLTEFQMNQYFGWIQGSNMPRIYVHLSGKNTDDAILSIHGIKKKSENEHKSKSRICPRCKTINPTCNDFCKSCGGGLDIKAAVENDEKMKNDRIKRVIADKVMNWLRENGKIRKCDEEEAIQNIIIRKVKTSLAPISR